MRNTFLKFRHFIFIPLLGILMFASCSNSEHYDPSPPAEIIYSGLVLNEVSGTEKADGGWIEIFNTANKSLEISGIQILKTDENGKEQSVFTVPQGTFLAAMGYEVVTASTNGLIAGISNTKQLVITLVKPDGKTEIDKFDRNACMGKISGHKPEGSYARLPNGIGSWEVLTTHTKGSANQE